MEATKPLQPRKKRIFLLLWFATIVGAWSVLPYLFAGQYIPTSVSTSQVFFLFTLQIAPLFGAVCWIASKVAPKAGLCPFVAKDVKRDILYPGLIWGVVVGCLLWLLDKTLFSRSALAQMTAPPRWTGALSSLYGAINEEVLARLFLFSAVFLLLQKVLRIQEKERTPLLWVTNILVALLFGLGHLPLVLQTPSFSNFEFVRIFLCNGIPSLIFGWLFWSRSLWTAMAAHFVADLVIHVVVV